MLKIGLVTIFITSFNIPLLSLMIFFIAYPDKINFTVKYVHSSFKLLKPANILFTS